MYEAIIVIFFAVAIIGSAIKKVSEAEKNKNRQNRPDRYDPRTGSFNAPPPAPYQPMTRRTYTPTVRPGAAQRYPAQPAPYGGSAHNPAVDTHLCEEDMHPGEKRNSYANEMFEADASYRDPAEYMLPMPKISASFRRASEYRLTGDALLQKQQELRDLRAAGIITQQEYNRMLHEYTRGY